MDKKRIIEEIKSNETVIFIGNGVFKGIKAVDESEMPYDTTSMILAINNGRAMSPKLMDDYSKAAMSIETRRGRPTLENLLLSVYNKDYPRPKVYDIVDEIKPKYVIDLNYDNSLQNIYKNERHLLITGIARIMAELDRFVCYEYDVEKQEYVEKKADELDLVCPILFKPLGGSLPVKNYIVSDADFVDWITEAMGGFAFPKFIKDLRSDKKYIFLGLDFAIDTQRMVANETTLNLRGGYTVSNKKPTKREAKFFQTHGLEVSEEPLENFIEGLAQEL